MSSTILYKFRSGQTFESLPLPGSAARLFDVKKAIVKAKKLDQGGQLEFDLSVRDASTDQEYVDEGMVLPRGTRVVVQRLPAARGHGFLARMARADAGMAGAVATSAATIAPSGFYTIDSRAHDDDEEFVSTAVPGDEEKELAALMAVTDPGTATTGGFRPVLTNRVAGSGPPPPSRGGSHFHTGGSSRQPRPNADPELREQERMPKKRATGIPRTFLNLSAPPVTDGTGETAEAATRLQPNAIGFEELVNRGGGQSESITGTKRDLDYALKLTSTEIPEHLQCGICHSVVKNAMLLPWDMEGRTACESCIRDALTSSGFVCPLTGMEGVSPDDLHPNVGLRKAAELFVKGVMEKMDEIDRQQVDEPDTEEGETSAAVNLEGESGDKGVIVSRRTMKDHKKKTDDDLFGGGDDDFGGDVFDVAPDEAEGEDGNAEKDGDEKHEEEQPIQETTADSADATAKDKDAETPSKETSGPESKDTEDNSKMNKPNQSEKSGDVPSQDQSPAAKARDGGTTSPHDSAESKRADRRRGPPAGYAMGPAGGAAVRGARRSPELERTGVSPNGRGGGSSPFAGGRGGRGEFFGRGAPRGGGRGGRFHGGGRYDDDFGRGRGRGGRGGYQQPRYDHQEEVSQSRLPSSSYDVSASASRGLLSQVLYTVWHLRIEQASSERSGSNLSLIEYVLARL